MLRRLMKILMSDSTELHPQSRNIYAVTGGTYLGELLVYIETEKETHKFLTLPEMKIRSIPDHNFKFGLKERIVEKVEKIPQHIYTVCKAQYDKNNNLLHK